MSDWDCQQADNDSAAHTATDCCLLLTLHPVRQWLHPFLSATAVARLRRGSRSTTALLLAEYKPDHDFTYRGQSLADVKRTIAVYGRYHMHIRRLSLPAGWNEPLVDSQRRPVLPQSLLVLSVGELNPGALSNSITARPSIVHVALDGTDGERDSGELQTEAEDGGERAFYRRMRPLTGHMSRGAWTNMYDAESNLWDVLRYGDCKGAFNQPIPPGALPRGLRFLQFNNTFNQPLQAGSIPDTVEVLQFGEAFNQPLRAGHLPASLTHLVFGFSFDQPLDGVLPAGLRQLFMGFCYNQRMRPGTLPPHLQQLSLGCQYNQPLETGIIPASVTHVRLSECFNKALQPGSIPVGVVHLNLGDHPLLPGVLPAPLRELAISQNFECALQSGSLPDGLASLAFHHMAKYQHQLQPRIIPASVTDLALSHEYKAPLRQGGIPATVRWVRLPQHYSGMDMSGVLSSSTQVAWSW